MGPLDKFILADDALSATAGGFDLNIRSHWYRSLPLSSLGKIRVKINGFEIGPDQMTIGLGGTFYGLDQLPSLYKTWWFVLDPATLHVTDPASRPQKGKRYKVEIEMGLLIPYVLTGVDEKPLLASSIVSKELTCY